MELFTKLWLGKRSFEMLGPPTHTYVNYIQSALIYIIHIRQLYYLDSQWLKSAATPGVCTMS
jgi:hypothetical protein